MKFGNEFGTILQMSLTMGTNIICDSLAIYYIAENVRMWQNFTLFI